MDNLHVGGGGGVSGTPYISSHAAVKSWLAGEPNLLYKTKLYQSSPPSLNLIDYFQFHFVVVPEYGKKEKKYKKMKTRDKWA